MKFNLQKTRSLLERKRGEYHSLRERLHDHEEQKAESEKRLCRLEKSQIIIQEVSKLTQQEVEFCISDLVSHGLAAVFDDPYAYKLEYVLRRDKTEADQFWRYGDHHFLPNGGGVRDVSAFVLHIACMVLSLVQKKGIKPILFLDEPFSGLKPSSLQERAGKMLEEISSSLGIQIIAITHDIELYGATSKLFKITKDSRRVSHVAEIQSPDRPDNRDTRTKQSELDGNNAFGIRAYANTSSKIDRKHNRKGSRNK